MTDFENNTEYELSEDDRTALLMTLDECLDNATDAQLEAIHNYALSVAPIPQAENVDRERVRALYDDISKVLVGIGEHKTPPMVAVAAYKTLGIGLDEEMQARIGLVDYLNNCTATAYQTGSLKLLEDMHKVVTTVHDLIGDYEDIDNPWKDEPASDTDPWEGEPASDLGPDPWAN